MTHEEELNEDTDRCHSRERENDGTEVSQCNYAYSLSELHNDILINIFSYLPYTDLTQARLVCRRWMEVAASKRCTEKFCLRINKDNVKDIWKQLQTGNFATGACYEYMIYMGTSPEQLAPLESILQQIGARIRSLKLNAFFDKNCLYEYFINLERLVLEDMNESFFDTLPFQMQTFPNLKAIHFIDDTVRDNTSNVVLRSCLHEISTARLEELSLRIYAYHAELFLQVLKKHADTLKSLHLVYFGAIEIGGMINKWMETFGQLRKLRKLKIYSSSTPIFEATLKCLEELPLRYLEVDCLKPVKPNIFKLIESCAPTLEHLAFFNFYLPARISRTHTTLIASCQNLRQLILSYTNLFKEDELCNIATNLVDLEVLVLSYCKDAVTNNSLAAIFKHLTQLRVLDLSGNNDFNVDGLTGLPDQPYSIQRLHRLEKLNFKSCQKLSNDEFLKVLKFPFLRSLSFGCGMYTSGGIEILVRQCPWLEELTITYCPALGRNALFCIAKALPRLRLLHLLHCSPVDKSVRQILLDECPLLKDLEISEKRANVNTYFDQLYLY